MKDRMARKTRAAARPAARRGCGSPSPTRRREPGRPSVPASPLPVAAAPEGPTEPDKPTDKGGAEVVRLDRFRKK